MVIDLANLHKVNYFRLDFDCFALVVIEPDIRTTKVDCLFLVGIELYANLLQFHFRSSYIKKGILHLVCQYGSQFHCIIL
jgi:hypothetical protein